jgi:hypothetical protein
VAQHDELEFPLTAAAGKHAHEAAQEPVQQTSQHEGSLNRLGRDHSTAGPAGIEFLYPTGVALRELSFRPRWAPPYQGGGLRSLIRQQKTAHLRAVRLMKEAL